MSKPGKYLTWLCFEHKTHNLIVIEPSNLKLLRIQSNRINTERPQNATRVKGEFALNENKFVRKTIMM